MFKHHFLKNRNHFLKFLLHFCKLDKILCILNKKISFIASTLARLLSLTNVVTSMPETSCFRTPFESKRVHVSQTLQKSARQHFYLNFELTTDKLSWKTSLSVRSEISGLLGNTFSADYMYCRHNWENFPQHVQTPLYQKPQPFSEIFFAFLQSTQNFVYFERKEHRHSSNILEVIDSEKRVHLNTRKLLF